MEKSWIEFWAPAATAHASAVDVLFAALLASCLFVVSVLFFLLLRFAIHYRAGSHIASRRAGTGR
jgi:heme/copper-type cytochrome/quinol oxidase subunit 2